MKWLKSNYDNGYFDGVKLHPVGDCGNTVQRRGRLLSLVGDRVALTSLELAKLTEGRGYSKTITKRNKNEIISLYADHS